MTSPLHGALGIQNRHAGPYFDSFGDGAELEDEIEARGLIDFEDDTTFVDTVKTFVFYNHAVIAGWQLSHRVGSVFTGHHFAQLARGCMANRDAGARN